MRELGLVLVTLVSGALWIAFLWRLVHPRLGKHHRSWIDVYRVRIQDKVARARDWLGNRPS